VPQDAFALKPGHPLANRILTTVKRLLIGLALLALALPAGAGAAPPRVLAIHFDTDVNPVTQDWVNNELGRAQSGGYSAVVILLDTPGGLEDSMRKIVQRELSLRIPVIVYVTPGGARAASAGVWISEAADVLAMAPATNIGSSTPITGSGQNIGSDLRRKVVNDAAASLRGLAKTHGRNAAWADLAVRKASNLTAQEALRMNVIDLIAPSLPALLTKIDGRVTVPRHLTLHTAGAQVTDVRPGFFTRFLSTLIDPNIVSLLFLAGLAGLGFELFHPGVVIPGAFGAICMVCALFGFSVLPLQWGGLILVLLGAALLVVDAHVVTHGALTLSGLVAMAIGFATLFHKAPAPYHTNIWVIATLTVLIGGFWAFAVSKAVAVRRNPVTVGPQQIVGMEGVVRERGQVFVRGELWRVRSAEALAAGEHVAVDALDGLTLDVHRIEA
jgi:membrane-bound serine protease (ClpP class)